MMEPRKKGRSRSAGNAAWCIEHNMPFVYYCMECPMAYCLKCPNDHENHSTRSLLRVLSGKEIKKNLETFKTDLEAIESGSCVIGGLAKSLPEVVAEKIERKKADLIQAMKIKICKLDKASKDCTHEIVEKLAKITRRYKNVKSKLEEHIAGLERILDMEKAKYDGDTAKAYKALLEYQKLTNDINLQGIKSEIGKLNKKTSTMEARVKDRVAIAMNALDGIMNTDIMEAMDAEDDTNKEDNIEVPRGEEDAKEIDNSISQELEKQREENKITRDQLVVALKNCSMTNHALESEKKKCLDKEAEIEGLKHNLRELQAFITQRDNKKAQDIRQKASVFAGVMHTSKCQESPGRPKCNLSHPFYQD